jgi:hypothetical protein
MYLFTERAEVLRTALAATLKTGTCRPDTGYCSRPRRGLSDARHRITASVLLRPALP